MNEVYLDVVYNICIYRNLPACWTCHGLPPLPRLWQHVKLSDVSLVTYPGYSIVVDEDVNKQTNPACNVHLVVNLVESKHKELLPLSYSDAMENHKASIFKLLNMKFGI